MVEHGLVERTTAGAVITVVATADGKRSVTRARRAHARAVRRALLSVVPPGSSAAFWEAVEQVGAPSPSAAGH